MTNGEKFKTIEDRAMAFRKFCANNICKGPAANCIFSGRLHDKAKHMCEFAWLELEYKEELKPCPFCGSRAEVKQVYCSDKYYIACSSHKELFKDCCVIAGVGARVYDTADEAISAWNRRV